jgi:hypothetical protein
MKKFSLLMATMCLAGCKPSLISHLRTTAYIIGGKDNIRRIEDRTPVDPAAVAPTEDLIKRVAETAVLIVTPLTTGETRFCSGNIYKSANGPVVLTNRHCFSPDKEHSASAVGFDPWACEKTQIYRGFDLATAQPSIRTTCEKGSLRVNPKLDLAVFKLADGATENGLELRATDPAPAERLRALIVHFPDVESQRIRMDITKFPGAPATAPRMAVTFEDCNTAGYFKPDAYSVDPSLPYAIRHTCDMIKGSSGSTLVDASTGESLGVNWGGIKFGDTPTSETYNIATRAGLVASFLAMPESDLDKFLLALAEKPPEGLVGNGEADATTERSSKSRHLSAAGCARISTHDENNYKITMDAGWLLLGASLVLCISRRRESCLAKKRQQAHD